MTLKQVWILFSLGVAVTLPLRVYQLFFLMDGQTDFLTGGTPTTLVIAVLLAAVFLVAFIACRKDPRLHVDDTAPKNGAGAFVAALTGLVFIFQSANLSLAALADMEAAKLQEYPNPAPYLEMALAVMGVFAGAAILVAGYGFLRGRSPLLSHPLFALLPTLWGCVALVLLFVIYTAKANTTQNIYDMLTMVFTLMFLFAQAKVFAGIETEKSIRSAFYFGIPAVTLALMGSIPCLLLRALGRRVPGQFPAGMHTTTLFLAIYILAFLFVICGIPQKKDAEPVVAAIEEENSLIGAAAEKKI